MAWVHNILEKWQGSQKLFANGKESLAPNMQMTAVGNLSDPEEIINNSWSNVELNGTAAPTLLEILNLPLSLSSKGLCAGWIEVKNLYWIQNIHSHRVKIDVDITCEILSDTRN